MSNADCFHGRRVAAGVLIAMALAAVLLLAARPAEAAPVTVPSDWRFFSTLGVGDDAGPYTFTSSEPIRITAVDILCRGDEWQLFDNGVPMGTTSDVAAYGYDGNGCFDPDPVSNDPDVTVLDVSYSNASIVVPAGSHSITLEQIASARPGGSAGGNIRFDLVAGPYWEVRTKVGGGNIYNQFLPDYTPGTWSTKYVTVYLFCVPGDAAIDLLRADRAVQFKDGEHTYSTKPTDECIDENGLAAEPIVDWGPIMVDTKAPACKVAPSTIFVARNTTAIAWFALDLTDSGSGATGFVSNSIASGGAIISGGFGFADDPPTSFFVEVTMGASTAGKVVTTISVADAAGNIASCLATVKAK